MSQFVKAYHACTEGALVLVPNGKSLKEGDPGYDLFYSIIATNLWEGAGEAKTLAEKTYPDSLQNGKGDALRHALWSVLNCFNPNVQDFTIATQISKVTTEHYEELSAGPALETQMDLMNGYTGRMLAKRFKDENPSIVSQHFSDRSIGFHDYSDTFLKAITEFIVAEIELGNLTVIRNGILAPSNPTTKLDWLIDVTFNKSSTKRRGVLEFHAYRGDTIYFTKTCACRGQGITDVNSPTSWTEDGGNTPLGRCYGYLHHANTIKDEKVFPFKYGPYKRIRLVGIESPHGGTEGQFYESEKVYKRDGIQIHGGRNPNPDRLWNTLGCIRVSDNDLKSIVDYIEFHSNHKGLVTIVEE